MQTHEFRASLLDAGLLVNSGVDGIFQRSFTFESIVRGVESYASNAGDAPANQRFFFAPVMPLATLVSSGYAHSFPNLMGVVSSFAGSDRELPAFLGKLDTDDHWMSELTASDVALSSAACHPLFSNFSHQSIPEEGLLYEIQGVCFRHEPSIDPARMQSFRQHEFVYLGTSDGALAHRDKWIELGSDLLRELGLDVQVVVANDPFFGRAGRILANGQIEKELKFELTAPISSDAPGAIASGNYHEDHMGRVFDITILAGGPMHSACFGLGLDRITLALIYAHGTDVSQWPRDVRALLSISNSTTGPS